MIEVQTFRGSKRTINKRCSVDYYHYYHCNFKYKVLGDVDANEGDHKQAEKHNATVQIFICTCAVPSKCSM